MLQEHEKAPDLVVSEPNSEQPIQLLPSEYDAREVSAKSNSEVENSSRPYAELQPGCASLASELDASDSSGRELREVKPTYGIDMKLTKSQIDTLVAKISDHTAPEHEWLRACHLLGDYKHTPPLVKRRSKRLAAAVAAFAILAGLGFLSWPKTDPPPIPSTLNQTPPPPAVSADIDFNPYMAALQRKIKRNWFPPRGAESRRVVVNFKIAPDGTADSAGVLTSSGLDEADNAALNAVANSAPFAPLPRGVAEPVDIQFTFDYNVFNQDSALTP
jgi:TonB family protein